MKKENILLVLWIIFGYLFITAVDAVLLLLVHVLYIGLSEMKVAYKIMSVIVPTITMILYVITVVLLLKNLNIKSKTNGIYLTKFPKKITIALGCISFLLPPITNRLTGLYAEHNSGTIGSGYLNFYGWLYIGIGVSQMLAILILIILFFNKLKQIE